MGSYLIVIMVFGIFFGITLIVLMGIAIYYYVAKKKKRLYQFEEDDLQVGMFFSLVVLSATLIPIVISAPIGCQEYEKKLHDIYSIKETSTGVNGDFFLGTGTIDTDMYYFVFVEKNGFKKIEKYNADKTYICETNDIEPSIWERKDKWEDKYSIMYVPENTIKIKWEL